jgi:hypothetical protein
MNPESDKANIGARRRCALPSRYVMHGTSADSRRVANRIAADLAALHLSKCRRIDRRRR